MKRFLVAACFALAAAAVVPSMAMAAQPVHRVIHHAPVRHVVVHRRVVHHRPPPHHVVHRRVVVVHH